MRKMHKSNVFFAAHLAKIIRIVAGVYNIHYFFKNCVCMYSYICICVCLYCV